MFQNGLSLNLGHTSNGLKCKKVTMHQLMEITSKSDVCMKTCHLVFGLQGGSISKSLKVKSKVTTHQMEPCINFIQISNGPTHQIDPRIYYQGCHVSGKCQGKQNFLQVREKSGNFEKKSGNFGYVTHVREFWPCDPCQGIVKEFCHVMSGNCQGILL